MAEAFLVMGKSGSGKSTAAETLNPEKTIVICPEDKTLPFPGALIKYKTFRTANGSIDLAKSNFIPIKRIVQYNKQAVPIDPGIIDVLGYISTSRPEVQVVLIDTFTYAMADSVMREIHVDNYKKFNVFAEEFYNLANYVKTLRKNLTVIITSHLKDETDSSGVRKESFKVPAGKLTENLIVPEGLFTMVLYAGSTIVDGKPVHFFETKCNGNNTCKTPRGMFSSWYIPNDYKYVLQTYYSYYAGTEPPAMPTDFPLKNQE